MSDDLLSKRRELLLEIDAAGDDVREAKEFLYRLQKKLDAIEAEMTKNGVDFE